MEIREEIHAEAGGEAAAEAASQNTAGKIQAQRNEGLDVLDEADVGSSVRRVEAAVVARSKHIDRSGTG